MITDDNKDHDKTVQQIDEDTDNNNDDDDNVYYNNHDYYGNDEDQTVSTDRSGTR